MRSFKNSIEKLLVRLKKEQKKRQETTSRKIPLSKELLVNPRKSSATQIISPIEIRITEKESFTIIRDYPYINTPPPQQLTTEGGAK